jgi:hypothetical protein
MDKPQPKENPLISILANVVLPVFILNKLSSQSPLVALVIAMAFPLGYGGYSFIRNKKINFISVLGILNTLFTGGFAILKLDGIWFAVKEAGFPLLIGVFVLFSSFGKSPFLKLILLDSGALNTDDLYKAIKEKSVDLDFTKLVQRFTLYFSTSFFLSAFLNFVLALRIFKKIPKDITEIAQTEMLNQQIADMTWQGYVVIFIPSILVLFVTFFFFFRKLTALTGLPFEKLVKETN